MNTGTAIAVFIVMALIFNCFATDSKGGVAQKPRPRKFGISPAARASAVRAEVKLRKEAEEAESETLHEPVDMPKKIHVADSLVSVAEAQKADADAPAHAQVSSDMLDTVASADSLPNIQVHTPEPEMLHEPNGQNPDDAGPTNGAEITAGEEAQEAEPEAVHKPVDMLKEIHVADSLVGVEEAQKAHSDALSEVARADSFLSIGAIPPPGNRQPPNKERKPQGIGKNIRNKSTKLPKAPNAHSGTPARMIGWEQVGTSKEHPFKLCCCGCTQQLDGTAATQCKLISQCIYATGQSRWVKNWAQFPCSGRDCKKDDCAKATTETCTFDAEEPTTGAEGDATVEEQVTDDMEVDLGPAVGEKVDTSAWTGSCEQQRCEDICKDQGLSISYPPGESCPTVCPRLCQNGRLRLLNKLEARHEVWPQLQEDSEQERQQIENEYDEAKRNGASESQLEEIHSRRLSNIWKRPEEQDRRASQLMAAETAMVAALEAARTPAVAEDGAAEAEKAKNNGNSWFQMPLGAISPFGFPK